MYPSGSFLCSGCVGAKEWGKRPGGDYVAPCRENPDISLMEEPSSIETETLRSMSAAKELAVMNSLIREAYRLRRAWIRLNEPGLSEQELEGWAPRLGLEEA